jgi:PucR C-terminal helix-turn-helix domain
VSRSASLNGQDQGPVGPDRGAYAGRGELEDAIVAIAARFEEGINDLAETIVAGMRSGIRELRGLEAPEIWDGVRDVTRRSRQTQIAHLREERELPRSCPEADREAIRRAARWGLSLTGVIQAYRIGQLASLDAWFIAADGLSMAERERSAVLRTVSRFAHRYDDRIMDFLPEEYESALRVRTGEAGRLRVIRGLIEGDRNDCAGLDYDLGLEHLGVVASGHGAREALRALAGLLDRRVLLGEAVDGVLTAWLGGRAQLTESGWLVLRRFEPGAERRFALGSPGAGVEGFRRTHRQAGEAYLVARRSPGPVTVYDDVSLVAFALRDESFARDLVANELGPLNDGTVRSRALLETLRRYLAAGQNKASTASVLKLSERTVARRLEEVEGLTGRRVSARHAELDLALRLEALLRHY